jgi:phospholipase C
LVIVMENHDYAQVAGHSPYLNGLAGRCGLATDFHGVAHPSLPNYVALTSGGTQGISTDCTSCSIGAPSIFSQVGDTGWKSYEEGMPSAGFTGPSSGAYVKRHNPPAYYTSAGAAFRTQSVPLGTVDSGPLSTDLHNGALPRFAFLNPDLCNDEHDCPVATGDAWLAKWVPEILGSPAYQAGDTALFVTYDENDNRADNHVYTVVAAPSVRPGSTSNGRFDHYALLATIEDLLGLGRLEASASAASMRPAFNL